MQLIDLSNPEVINHRIKHKELERKFKDFIVGMANALSERHANENITTLCDFCAYCKYVNEYESVCTKVDLPPKWSREIGGEKGSMSWVEHFCTPGIMDKRGPDESEIDDSIWDGLLGGQNEKHA